MERISVIIPTYNRSAFVKKAIDSVLEQTYQNFELIIVDDGSTDQTQTLIGGYGDRLKYIYQNNQGPSKARNRGIQESEANLVAFLDSDDWWARDKLKIQLKAMQDNPDYPISHTQEIWYKNSKLLNQKKIHKKFGGYIFDRCLGICTVSISTAMVKKQLFRKVGLFDESFPCCEDYDFWLRVSIKHPFLLIDEPLTLKDGGRADQVSSIFAQGIDKLRIDSIKNLLEKNSLNSKQRILTIQELDKKCKIYGEGCIKHGRKREGKFYLSFVQNFKNQ